MQAAHLCDNNIIFKQCIKKKNMQSYGGCQAISSHTLFLCPRTLLEMMGELKMYIQFVSVVQFPAVVFHFIVF